VDRGRGDLHHHATLQYPAGVDCNLPEPETGDRTSQKQADGSIDYRRTLTDQIGVRARSRLFEMCKVVHMPLVRDYRLRKSTAF
jgi:DNA replication protein DnaC